jgi:hypothetical protein
MIPIASGGTSSRKFIRIQEVTPKPRVVARDTNAVMWTGRVQQCSTTVSSTVLCLSVRVDIFSAILHDLEEIVSEIWINTD